MTWAALLLADPSPCLRWHVLNLLGETEEAEELAPQRQTDPLVVELVRRQNPDGSWGTGSQTADSTLKMTSVALTRLAYLGFNAEYEPIQSGAEYLYQAQRDDGSWPLGAFETDAEGRGNYDTMSLQTSIPLRGLAEAGYASDPRSEAAYTWLLGQRLEDGAWPTGRAQGNLGYVAGYRRLPHSRWGCRSNTVSALTCLSLHPERSRGEAARRALDLLLGRETRETGSLGSDLARTLGYEPVRGFLTFYARHDMAHLLRLCVRVGAGVEDLRVGELVEFIRGEVGEYGLWTYMLNPMASRWLSYDLLTSLGGLGSGGDWVTLEPRTPFTEYPRRRRRF